MGVGYSPRIVTNGLVFYVNPSDPKCYSGGSTCKDLTRINGDGILSDVTLSSDKAFRMNSSTSRVYFTRSYTNITNSVTFMVTAEVPSTVDYPVIMTSMNGALGGMTIYAYSSAESLISAFISNDSSTLSDEIIDGISSYPFKKVIGFTINGTVFKLYINGKLISTHSPHSAGDVNAQNFIDLGYSSEFGAGTAPNVKIYNSLIYNRALNDNEILQNHNALKGRLKL
jgi:hypothetical protein